MHRRQLSLLRARPTTIKVKHYIGLPPQLTGVGGARKLLGPAAYLIIDERPDGVFLCRFDNAGVCVGDTWHASVEDAEHQANYEYEELVHDWRDVPPDVKDAAAFGLARLHEAS